MFGNTKTDYKIMIILILLGGLGYFLGLPYLIEMSGETEVPFLDMILSTLLNTLIVGIMVFIGYNFAHRVSLGAPIIKGKLEDEPVSDKVKIILRYAPILGIVSGILVGLLDVFIFVPLLTGTVTPTTAIPSIGSRMLAMFYGGFYEEIYVRFFIMSILVWFFWKLSRSENVQSHSWIFWLGLIMAAVLFGALHLPAAAMVYGLTPIVITRTLILNLIPGLIFGWLYWKQGIESAMVSHMCADFTIHVIITQIILAFL